MKTKTIKNRSPELDLIVSSTFEIATVSVGDLSALTDGQRSSVRELQSVTRRKKWVSAGDALPDGTLPIPNVSYLKKAVDAYSRVASSLKPRAKRWIVRRARALDRPDLLPEAWGVAAAAHARTAAAGQPQHDGVMVAIYPPPELAAALAGDADGDETSDQLHVTLAYLGTVDEFTDEELELARRAVASVTLGREPLEASVQGTGTFSAPESDDPRWYSIDALGLAELRTEVVRALEQHGVQPRADHDFTPHMTVRYGGDELAEVPTGGDAPWPVDALVFVAAGERSVHPLGHNYLEPQPPDSDEAIDEHCGLCGLGSVERVHNLPDVPEWLDRMTDATLALDDVWTEFVKAPGPCSLNRSPRYNWVEKVGGLPNYVCQVARAIARGGRALESAIPIAIGKIRDWAEGKDNVSEEVRARSQATMAEWDKKKAEATTETVSLAVDDRGTDELLKYVTVPSVSVLTLEEGSPMARVATIVAGAGADWSKEFAYFWNTETDAVYRVSPDDRVEIFAVEEAEEATEPGTDATPATPIWREDDVNVANVRELPAVDDPETLEAIVGASVDDTTTGLESLPEGAGSRFRIPIVIPEGVQSGDRRTFSKGALEFKEPPIPLLWQKTTDEGHKGSVTVGKITSIERLEGGLGNAEGVFDTHEDAIEAARQVKDKFLTGVSGDVDQFKAELAEGENDDEDQLSIHHARLVAATLVAKPAFQEATIELVPRAGEEQVITAAGGPLYPPREWFGDPQLTEPTRLVVTDEGRVYGHIGLWATRHRSNPLWKLPSSPSDYAHFHTGTVKTAEGDMLDSGVITLTGGHADLELSAREAAAHYDDTRSAVCDVRAGRDAHGTWVAGAMRPGISDFQLRAFRASHPSVDCRPIDGKLDLIAVCQVNTPGFPVARALVADGRLLALVAAGAAELYDDRDDATRVPASVTELVGRVTALEARFAEQDRREELQRREQLAAAITA